MVRTGISSKLVGACLVAAVAASGAALAAVPPNDGWVTDLAGFLSPQQEQSLEALMQSYKDGSGNEIALLTVPDLGGQSLERFALEVGRAWGIGEKERHNGALLLVSRGDRKIRIEVGRGLEGNLTDSISGRIIRNVITPEFRKGRFAEGLRAGIEAMHAAAGGDYARIPEDRGRGSDDGWAGLVPLIFFLIFFLSVTRRVGGLSGCLPWLLLGSMGRGGFRSSGWRGGTNISPTYCWIMNWPNSNADGTLGEFSHTDLQTAINNTLGTYGGWDAKVIAWCQGEETITRARKRGWRWVKGIEEIQTLG